MRRFVLCAVVLWCAGLVLAATVPRPAPPLNTITPTGKRVSLSDFRGKVVVLEFFLTDCPHCQNSARNIMTFYEQWKPRGLEVLGVAINPGPEWSVNKARAKSRMRLCFASPSHEEISQGVATLAEVCRREFGIP